MKFFPTTEGYVKNDNGNYSYIYQYKNHLGNVRLSYSDSNNDGSINSSTEIVEANHYYPFGLKQKIASEVNNQSNYKYKYNGKEVQDELGLDFYDFGARNYDPALGRWMNIDPLAEKSRRFSPYVYALNNPVFFIDPDGMEASPPDWYQNMETKELTWFEGSGKIDGYKYVGPSAFQDNGNGTTTIYNNGGTKDTATNLEGLTIDKYTRWEGTYFDRSNYGRGENPYSPYTPDGYAITFYGSIDWNGASISGNTSFVLDGNTNQLAGFYTGGIAASTTTGFSWNFGVSLDVIDKYDAPESKTKYNQKLFDRILGYSKGGGATFGNWGVSRFKSAEQNEFGVYTNPTEGIITHSLIYSKNSGIGASYGITKTNRLF